MTVVQAMLRHASITTSNPYTTVLPTVARDTAEKTTMIIPQASARRLGRVSGSYMLAPVESSGWW